VQPAHQEKSKQSVYQQPQVEKRTSKANENKQLQLEGEADGINQEFKEWSETGRLIGRVRSMRKAVDMGERNVQGDDGEVSMRILQCFSPEQLHKGDQRFQTDMTFYPISTKDKPAGNALPRRLEIKSWQQIRRVVVEIEVNNFYVEFEPRDDSYKACLHENLISKPKGELSEKSAKQS
jgi:hypothetical protein